MWMFWRSLAFAWQSETCGLAVDLPGTPSPAVVPHPPSVESAEGWTWPPSPGGVATSVACVTLPEVPERRGAREILGRTADMLGAQLAAVELSRATFDWHGQPGLVTELQGGVGATRIVVWQVFAGRRHLQVHLVGEGLADLPAADRAILDRLRPLAPIVDVPPSQRPLTTAPWRSPDGRLSLDAPTRYPTPQGHAVVEAQLRSLSTDIDGVSVPFDVALWYAPGHGSFGLRWARLPGALPQGTPAQVLDRVLAGQTAPMKLTDVTRADLAGPHGPEAWVRGRMPIDGGRKQWPARLRVLVVGDLAVIAVAYGPEGELNEADVDKILGSVQVNP